MSLKGFFTADRREYYLGDPIWVTLAIRNETDNEVHLFVPRGRVNGIQIAVKEGNDVQIKGMTDEPEPGLVSETKVPPGETYRQPYLLTQWLLFKKPGHYTIECTLEIEWYTVSLRQKNVNRVGTNVSISTEFHLTILTPVRQTMMGK